MLGLSHISKMTKYKKPDCFQIKQYFANKNNHVVNFNVFSSWAIIKIGVKRWGPFIAVPRLDWIESPRAFYCNQNVWKVKINRKNYLFILWNGEDHLLPVPRLDWIESRCQYSIFASQSCCVQLNKNVGKLCRKYFWWKWFETWNANCTVLQFGERLCQKCNWNWNIFGSSVKWVQNRVVFKRIILRYVWPLLDFPFKGYDIF